MHPLNPDHDSLWMDNKKLNKSYVDMIEKKKKSRAQNSKIQNKSMACNTEQRSQRKNKAGPSDVDRSRSKSNNLQGKGYSKGGKGGKGGAGWIEERKGKGVSIKGNGMGSVFVVKGKDDKSVRMRCMEEAENLLENINE
jgi:hypothetical protein